MLTTHDTHFITSIPCCGIRSCTIERPGTTVEARKAGGECGEGAERDAGVESPPQTLGGKQVCGRQCFPHRRRSSLGSIWEQPQRTAWDDGEHRVFPASCVCVPPSDRCGRPPHAPLRMSQRGGMRGKTRATSGFYGH